MIYTFLMVNFLTATTATLQQIQSYYILLNLILLSCEISKIVLIPIDFLPLSILSRLFFVFLHLIMAGKCTCRVYKALKNEGASKYAKKNVTEKGNEKALSY